jgi:NodT family efflux transporter outer membrane factor (OMF) lipoprotein
MVSRLLVRRAMRGASAWPIVVLLASCAVGPDYVRPIADTPSAFKESEGWKPAEPRAIDPHQPWWTWYGDPVLDGLVAQVDGANQTLRQAEAQYRAARAAVDVARAGYWPQVGANASVQRGVSSTQPNAVGTSLSVGLTASWEPDLWGGVRRAVEAGQAAAEASGDDLAAARLSIQSALAQDYFQLRYIDVARSLYVQTIADYARALDLTRAQYAQGVVLRSDVALAETQLTSTQAAAADLDAQRAAFEHAIAILIGKPPASFALPPAEPVDAFGARLPAVPLALPSELLERRPDIAAAERRAAAANAEIGVAQAAYFPQLSLSASGAGVASTLARLIETPTRFWSLGAVLAQTVFDGGLRSARSAQAVATYDANVAAYRQTVLTAFQQIEDDLATLRVLDQETALQDAAVRSAQVAERLALAQYRGGTATYLAVVTAQTLSLSNQRTAVQLHSRQLATSVGLIAALGGGWQAGTPVAGAASAPVAERGRLLTSATEP